MRARTKILLSLGILLTTMACAFVQNIIFPASARPENPVAHGTRDPVPTLALTAEFSTPLPGPVNNPEPILCDNDDCLDACLERLEEVLETQPFEAIGNSIYEEQGAEFNLVIYKVDGDDIGEPAVLYVPSEYHKYQEDTASHRRIWDFYVAIIPPELREIVHEFVIYTDGPWGDTSAWVNPSPREAGSWQVGIDLLDSDYPPYLAEALVHETVHLLTLNSSQVPFEEDQHYYYDEKLGDFLLCDQYAVDGGCSLPDSYINLFYQRFWKDSYAEWWELEQEAQDTESFDEYLDVMEQFYEEHSDWFVNSYAATNVEEDIAESFTYFALNPKPTGDSVYEQKVAFFYEFPELVEYRQRMIEGVCSYIR